MGLVVQVRADHRRSVGVAGGQHLPVVDPGLFRESALEPEAAAVGARAGGGAVVVEDDLEADLAGIGDDLVHDLQAVEAGEVRVPAVVDAVGSAARGEELVGEGQADRVEAQIRHLVHHLLVVARMKAVGRVATGLHAEPVHARDLHHVVRRIEDLIAARVKETRSYAPG
jgi:hypothetical protein